LRAHGEIASAADGSQIHDFGGAALALRYIMTDIEIECSYDILAPADITFVAEIAPCVFNPDLLTQRFWYGRFYVGLIGHLIYSWRELFRQP